MSILSFFFLEGKHQYNNKLIIIIIFFS